MRSAVARISAGPTSEKESGARQSGRDRDKPRICDTSRGGSIHRVSAPTAIAVAAVTEHRAIRNGVSGRSTSRHGRFPRMTARMPESVVANVSRLAVKNSVAPFWRPPSFRPIRLPFDVCERHPIAQAPRQRTPWASIRASWSPVFRARSYIQSRWTQRLQWNCLPRLPPRRS